jgi:hypothetical protein
MAEQTAIIPINTAITNDIELCGAVDGCFQIPAAFTGATVAVKISIDGVTYTEVVEEGAEANPITVSAGGTYAIPKKAFAAKFMQLLSASNEAAARSILIFLRK